MNTSTNGETFKPDFQRVNRGEPESQAVPATVVAYWIHYAGGGLSSLFRASQSLTHDFPMDVFSPGMPARDELVDVQFDIEIDQMAQKMAVAIASDRDRQGDQRPFVVIGHSYGTILAYRIASHLIDRHHQPHRLVVMSFPAADRMTHEQALHKLSDQQLVETVDSLFGGVPEAILNDPEATKYFAPALRFDLGMLERYQHVAQTERIDVPITAICGTEDKAVDLAQMQRWQNMTSGDFRLRSMPGDHFFPINHFEEVLRLAAWEWFDL